MPSGPQLSPFVGPPPADHEDELRALVEDQYGPVTGWHSLGGEEDLNIRVQRAAGPAFLKVSRADPGGFADFQTELIDYLARQRPALPVPSLILTRRGERSVISDLGGSGALHLRMTTFLTGKSVGSVTLESGLHEGIGRTLGRLDVALARFPGRVPDRPTNWNMMMAGDVLAGLIPARAADRDPEHRVWGAVLEQFLDTTLPQLAVRPRQVIHNDLNGSNLLLDTAAREVTGLFDFGDVVEAPRVIDLAVAAAYLVDGRSAGRLLASLGRIIGGYRAHAELSPEEAAIVPELMKARYAMALTLNRARAEAASDPGQRRYVLRNFALSQNKLALLLAGRLTPTDNLSHQPAEDSSALRTQPDPEKSEDSVNQRAELVSTSGEMVNAFDPSLMDELPPTTRSIIQRRRKVLGPAYRLQYARPAEFDRGEGVWLFDSEGRQFLDAYNNVPSVGHCHPHVVAEITRQAAQLNTNTRYLDAKILDYAERLLQTHDESLDNVMFTCTGSEANDLALRVSRYHTGGHGVIISRHAYHGITSATASISPTLGAHVPLGGEVRTVGLPFGMPADQAASYLEDQVEVAVADLERHGIRLCAFIFDTLFTSDGILADPPGFIAPAVAVARAAGGLFIADEVQPGFGRTGEAMWGYQRHGVSPDIAVMGKPMGNGMPIAGIAARSDILERFGVETRYFNTFGGNSVSIAAAAAVLDVIENEDLISRARTVGAELRSQLEAAVAGRPQFGEIRGSGLYLGVDVLGDAGRSGPQLATQLVNSMRNHGVLISATGVHGQTLKIRPPLVFSKDHVDTLMKSFSVALEEI